MPEESLVLSKSAYRTQPNKPTTVPIYLYNFGQTTARGRLQTTTRLEPAAPSSANLAAVDLPTPVEIVPGDRKELPMPVTFSGPKDSVLTVRVEGDFGKAGKPILSFRLVAE